MGRYGKLKIFSGTANRKLAADICKHLEMDLSPISTKSFSDGEFNIEIGECADGRGVRGDDIFFIQPTCNPVHDNLVELVLAIDAFKRASAGRITAVIPYYGYARQDRKVRAGVPISSKAIAIMIMGAGANRVIFMDLHAPQIAGFFEIPVDHLYASPIIIDYLSTSLQDFVMVSPDAGGVERARAYAKRLGADLAIVDKRREKANESEAMHLIGDVRGKTAVLVDDMVDTAGTLCGAAKLLIERGATEVYAACSHGVLSGPAIKRINDSNIKQLITVDTISQEENSKNCSKLKVLSIAPILAQAIKEIHIEGTVKALFK